MDEVFEDFEARVSEIDSYLKLLDRLEDPDVVLLNKSTRKRLKVLREDSRKVMKASAFLLIYNLVESAIKAAFGSLYAEIEKHGKSVADLSEELQDVWLAQQFQPYTSGVSVQSCREVADTVVQNILTASIAHLSSDRLPVSGNLDAETIRKVCQRHGISIKVDARARGGSVLETVKQQRNALGHGEVSFAECGQQFSVRDLKRFKREAVYFVRGILKNIRKHVDEQHYVA